MREHPFVSVIVINYNGKKYLGNLISSILNNKYPKDKYELIIIDNNSTDGSVEYLKRYKSYPLIKIVCLKKNIGWTGGANLGVKIAKGEYIVILNNDIIVDKLWLLELVRAITTSNAIGVCCSKKKLMDKEEILDGAGGTMNIIGQGWDHGMLRKDSPKYNILREVTHPSGASFIISRDIIDTFKHLFDPDFFLSQDDLDLGWRTRLLGYKVIYVPTSVILHKRGGSPKPNPLVYYFKGRNLIVTFIKNLKKDNLIKLLSIVVPTVVIEQIYGFIAYKDPKFISNISRIVVYLIKNYKKIVNKRKNIQSIRRIDDSAIFSLFSQYILAPRGVEKLAYIYSKMINLYLTIVRIKGAPKFRGIFTYPREIPH